jgi:hypothetical protein
LNSYDLKQRILLSNKKNNKDRKFGLDPVILHKKLESINFHTTEVETYYLHAFNNVRVLDTKYSKEGVFDLAKQYIETCISTRQFFARGLLTEEPVNVTHMSFTQDEILSNLTKELRNFCPVTLKASSLFTQNPIRNG